MTRSTECFCIPSLQRYHTQINNYTQPSIFDPPRIRTLGRCRVFPELCRLIQYPCAAVEAKIGYFFLESNFVFPCGNSFCVCYYYYYYKSFSELMTPSTYKMALMANIRAVASHPKNASMFRNWGICLADPLQLMKLPAKRLPTPERLFKRYIYPF